MNDYGVPVFFQRGEGGRKKREPCTNTPNRQSYSRSIAIFDPTGTPASCATGWHFAAIRNATGGRSCRSKRNSKFAMPFAMTRVQRERASLREVVASSGQIPISALSQFVVRQSTIR